MKYIIINIINVVYVIFLLHNVTRGPRVVWKERENMLFNFYELCNDENLS